MTPDVFSHDKKAEPGETYLGDGLYATYDGYHVTLRAPRITGDHYVYLDPETWAALQQFMAATDIEKEA